MDEEQLRGGKWLMTALILFAGTLNANEHVYGAISAEVKAALENNATALSPLTVTWERTRDSDLAVPRILEVLGVPLTAVEIMAPEKVHFMWDNGKFYRYIWRHMPQVDVTGKYLPNKPLELVEQETSFDLEAYYNGTPNKQLGEKAADPIILIEPVDKMTQAEDARICVADYLYNAGFAMPSNALQLTTRTAQSLLLQFIAEGAQVVVEATEQVNGNTYLIVELKKDGARQRFLLDPRYNYAMRQRSLWYSSGEPEATIDCHDFVELKNSAGSYWLPRRIELLAYHEKTGPSKPLYKEMMKVTELNNNPIAPSQFVLKYDDPGTHIADGRLPKAAETDTGRIRYVVPANPEDLDEAIQSATVGLTPDRSFGKTVFLVLNIAIFLGLLAFTIVRRRRNAL